MYFDKKDISNLNKINRINLMNSITGIKPVLLIGTKGVDNISNLAIFSSIVHISSNPALFGFFLKASGVATSSMGHLSHRPPLSLRVLNPLSALIPAPVKTTIFFILKSVVLFSLIKLEE